MRQELPAWLGGFFTSGPSSDPQNKETAWRVVDNGEGANNPPDQASGLLFGPNVRAAERCATTPNGPPLVTLPPRGNIQVRP